MLVARDKEKALLLEAAESDESKFIAVYGRRRIGKTYLIRETFGRHFAFQHSGYANGTNQEQLFAFSASLREAGLNDFKNPRNWLEAFELLKEVVRRSPDRKKVVFIDELSWMDTARSDLMLALEGFWNGWASARTDVVLIVCASATSWMMKHVVHNKGGLYNRLSLQIALRPFTLQECEAYARYLGLAMNRYQLLECYMVLGGVPYYWSLLRRGLSLSQNIDALFFASDAPLKREFRYLYASIFRKPEPYLAIIAALGEKKAGMERGELLRATGLGNTGLFSARLEELESCGFIRKYQEFGKRRRNALYQLVDNFTLFYFKFLKKEPTDEHFWTNQLNTPARNAWSGLAFERVCLQHIRQIKEALGIAGVLTHECAWSCHADPERGINGSQIDLLIDRKDQVINLCEMKFSTQEYAVSKTLETGLRHKINDLQKLEGTKSAIHPVLVSPYGVMRNSWSDIFQSVLTAEDLFR
ncbi:MAG: ATP-binding protein [Sutterellaceae bacterium]|nr:ATP-binding protein [Sutterellaceae bacterium]MDY2868260.1 ATP-binding protein [Mesosutterella sp.]